MVAQNARPRATFSIAQFDSRANGNWPLIFSYFEIPIPSDGKHGPSPLSGGKDRFRLFKEPNKAETGMWIDSGGKDQKAECGHGTQLVARYLRISDQEARQRIWEGPLKGKSSTAHPPAHKTAPAPVRLAADGSLPPLPPAAFLAASERWDRYAPDYIVLRHQTPKGKACFAITYDPPAAQTPPPKGKRPHPGNGWIWGKPSRPHHLLGLYPGHEGTLTPHLKTTTTPTAPVLVLEGEKCVATATPMLPSYTITTAAGGTACFTPDHTIFSPLAGRTVICWPDNDEKGKQAMDAFAAAALAAGAHTVRILTPPPEKPQGWDLADAVADGWQEAELQNLLKTARPFTPRSTSAGRQTTERIRVLARSLVETSGFRDPFLLATDLAFAIREELNLRISEAQCKGFIAVAQQDVAPAQSFEGGKTYRIRNLTALCDRLFANGLNLLAGESGSGKSRAAMTFARAWLHNEPTFLGRRITSPILPEDRHILLVGPDQDASAWSTITSPLDLTQSTPATDGNDDWTLSPRISIHCAAESIETQCERIKQWAMEHPGCLVIVDSLSQLAGSHDQNDAAIASIIYQLKSALGPCPGILTHHAAKEAAALGVKGIHLVRGSGQIPAAVDRVITLTNPTRTEGGRVISILGHKRELWSGKRGGDPLELTVDVRTWTDVTPSPEDLGRQRKEHLVESLTEGQRAVYDLIAATPEQWHSQGSLVEASPNKRSSTLKQLGALMKRGLIVCHEAMEAYSITTPLSLYEGSPRSVIGDLGVNPSGGAASEATPPKRQQASTSVNRCQPDGLTLVDATCHSPLNPETPLPMRVDAKNPDDASRSPLIREPVVAPEGAKSSVSARLKALCDRDQPASAAELRRLATEEGIQVSLAVAGVAWSEWKQ